MKSFISSAGRLSRQGYLLGFVLPVLALAALTAAVIFGWFSFPPVGMIQVLALGWMVLLFGVGDAMNIRRYHDIGNSGRLYRLCRPGIVVLPLLAFVIDFFIPAQMASTGDMEAVTHMIVESVAPTLHPVTIALLVIPAVGVVVNLMYLVAMPGQAGPNEHGPNPASGGSHVPGAPTAPTASTPKWAAEGGDDPVKRALADYQARQAKAARPAQTGVRPATPAGPATFGRKR